MKKIVFVLTALIAFAGTTAHADEATKQAVIKRLMDLNTYTVNNLTGMDDTVAEGGSYEFWSSGGLLNKVGADASPQEFESFNMTLKHIKVITLVPGQVAVAQYYSEGSMNPKNSSAVNDYRVRVTQVLVNEGGKWKVRAAHWSPIAGGSGTSQTALVD